MRRATIAVVDRLAPSPPQKPSSTSTPSTRPLRPRPRPAARPRTHPPPRTETLTPSPAPSEWRAAKLPGSNCAREILVRSANRFANRRPDRQSTSIPSLLAAFPCSPLHFCANAIRCGCGRAAVLTRSEKHHQKTSRGKGNRWVAALGNDRGYDDDIHLISPVIVAQRGNTALQRKNLKRSVEEVTPSAPQKSCKKIGFNKAAGSARIDDAIGDGSYLRHLRNVMDADNVRPAENARRNGRGCRKNRSSEGTGLSLRNVASFFDELAE